MDQRACADSTLATLASGAELRSMGHPSRLWPQPMPPRTLWTLGSLHALRALQSLRAAVCLSCRLLPACSCRPPPTPPGVAVHHQSSIGHSKDVRHWTHPHLPTPDTSIPTSVSLNTHLLSPVLFDLSHTHGPIYCLS